MAHRRKLIRDAVLLALTGPGPTYPTPAGARVFNNRVTAWPVRLLDLGPCVSLYAIDEQSKLLETAPRRYKRTLELAIEAAAKAGPGGDVDDTLDEVCVAIERRMDADPTFGKVCGDSVLSSTDIEVAREGDTEIGNVRLVYDVTYYTFAPDPADVDELDDLETIGGAMNPGADVDEDDQPQNEVDFTAPTMFLDAGQERPAEHADPQLLSFSVVELLADEDELWIDAPSSGDPGNHTINVTHVATAQLLKSTSIAPASGRVLGVFDTDDLIALGPLAGYFRIDVLDQLGAPLDSLHFTLTP